MTQDELRHVGDITQLNGAELEPVEGQERMELDGGLG
jgi:hypothetical protein